MSEQNDMEQQLAAVEQNAATKDAAADAPDGMGFGRYVFMAALGLGGVILLVIGVGVVLAIIGPSGATADRLSMIRDVFIIVVALEFILIILALVVLIMQVTRLIVMLQNEIKPIVRDTKQTVDNARGAASFVGKNVAQPIINTSGFLAGAWVFVKEVGGIRRAIRRTDGVNKLEDHSDGE